MRLIGFSLSVILLAAQFSARSACAADADIADVVQKLSTLKVEGLYYIAYQNGKTNTGASYNGFVINRGYTTFKKKLTPQIDSRITLDLTQDETGDIKVRAKYVYALYKLGDIGPLTRPEIEFGLVHTPWLDYEEHLNYYRMQGTMFMERLGIFNSADFGVTLASLLGGEVDADYQKMVSNKYPGRYGSIALGVYNGGGYHAMESNLNKVTQGRLTIRPVPDVASGLQASYFGIFGRGNRPDGAPNTDWQTNALLVSYEHEKFVVDGQYITGHGNQKGTWAVEPLQADSVDYAGYSVFGEYKPGGHWRLMIRMDSFDPNTDVDSDVETRWIAGVGYDFGHSNILLLDYDTLSSRKPGVRDASAVKLTMQVSY